MAINQTTFIWIVIVISFAALAAMSIGVLQEEGIIPTLAQSQRDRDVAEGVSQARVDYARKCKDGTMGGPLTEASYQECLARIK